MLFKMKDKLKPIIVDAPIRRLSFVSIFFNLAAWILLVAKLFPLVASGRLIALHYNVYLKVNDIGPAGLALVPALIGTLIIVINFWLAARTYRSSRQNTLVILAITAFYEFLIALASLFIILVNLSR